MLLKPQHSLRQRSPSANDKEAKTCNERKFLVADPGFPRRGANDKCGASIYYLTKFFPIKKIGPGGRLRVPAVSPPWIRQ